MKTLITIRDSIKDFISKYEKFVMPVMKFVVALLVQISFNSVMGYSTDMMSPALIFLISLICAFLPIQLTVLVMGIVGFVHMYAVSLEVGVTYLALFVIMYLLYLRFAPKYGWLVILMPLFYLLKLHYMVPIIVGIFIGPVGIVPTVFGVIFYYFTRHVGDLVALLATASEEDSIQGYNYILNGLIQNKSMLLTIVVFILVIAVTYLIYRQSFQYSWIVAIGTGAILSIVLFLMGGIVLEADIDILVIFLGTVAGALLSVVAQFFKGVLDYSRTENVQFEDDEYYYYVKAVPKVRVAEQNVTIKKINEKKVKSQSQGPARMHTPEYTSEQQRTQNQVYDSTRRQAQSQRLAGGAVQRTTGTATQRTVGTATQRTTGTATQRTAGTAAQRTVGTATQRTTGTAAQRTAGAATQRTAGAAAQRTANTATQRTAGAATQRTAGTAAQRTTDMHEQTPQ